MTKERMAPLVWADSVTAGVIADELEEQGIPVQLVQVHAAILAGPLGLFRVMVPRSRAPSAMAVLEHLRERHPSMRLDFTGQSERLPPVIGW